MLNICIFLLQNKSVTPEELGPIACLAGYAIQLLYQQSKKSKDADFSRNDETHVYIFSMKVPTDENTFLVGQFNAEVLIKECQCLLCFKNIVKLYASVEVHSFARVIVTSTNYFKKEQKSKHCRNS